MFSLFFLLSNVYAEPQFTKLEAGEVAPWSGRLFNDEAVSKLIVTDKFKVEECNIQIEYVLSKQLAELSLTHKKAQIDLDMQVKILEDKVSLRDNRIQSLESIKTPPNHLWYTTAGILIGSGITIGITYAVNQ